MEKVRWLLKRGTPYIIILFLGILVLILTYKDNTFRAKTTISQPGSSIIEGIFEGYILCQICDLDEKPGNHHDCTTSGHQHVFKITKVLDTEGNHHNELNGKTLSYKHDKSDLLLLGKLHGERSRMKGKIYLKEELVKVKSIRKINTSLKRLKNIREPWLIS